MVGRTLGHYEIIEPLGAGGMGEVYRAHDTILKRDVAIKVLPEDMAADVERLARLEREAHLLASLNHPNVATIHGLEEANADDGPSVRFLVLAVAEGGTLADRLVSGALGVEEALEIAMQIARGLEAAHDRGIVHRDLKPGNIKITPDGLLKVLDFGLAKPTQAEGGDAGDELGLTLSPTLTVAGTEVGVILGTAPYMSPEQVRGEPVDRRTDVWAFGCVLYEMLTGRRTFSEKTISDTLAAVLKDEPDWSALPAETPLQVGSLLRRCLHKEPDRRLHEIADARIELEETLGDPAVATLEMLKKREAPRAPWLRLGWSLLAVLAVAIAATVLIPRLLPRSPPAVPPLARLAITLPAGAEPVTVIASPLAIAPDGNQLVHQGALGTTSMLFSRRVDQLESTPLAGTEGGGYPFFSPDGESIGFASPGRLLRLRLGSDVPSTICDLDGYFRGATWGADDTIVFSSTGSGGLLRVAAAGGEPEVLTTLDTDGTDVSHRWPEFLPGGEAVVFSLWEGFLPDESSLAVVTLATGEIEILLQGGTDPQYAASGHLLYSRAASLMAVPFDPDRLRVTGRPVPVAHDVHTNLSGAAFFAVSTTGALFYQTPSRQQDELVLVDREGTERPLAVPSPLGRYASPRFSPDGNRVAVGAFRDQEYGVWVYDLERGTLDPLTQPGWGLIDTPLWSPDGARVAYSLYRERRNAIAWTAADGTGEQELLFVDEGAMGPMNPNSFSPDGRVLLYQHQRTGVTEFDIVSLPVGGEGAPMDFVATPSMEGGAAFSPDGRWVAYASSEPGSIEIYVQPYPGPGGRIRVSSEGGRGPAWSPDGRELFYISGSRLMVGPVEAGSVFSRGNPRALVELAPGVSLGSSVFPRDYDIAPDGQHFVFVRIIEGSWRPSQRILVLNWFEELKRLVPTEK